MHEQRKGVESGANQQISRRQPEKRSRLPSQTRVATSHLLVDTIICTLLRSTHAWLCASNVSVSNGVYLAGMMDSVDRRCYELAGY